MGLFALAVSGTACTPFTTDPPEDVGANDAASAGEANLVGGRLPADWVGEGAELLS